MRIIVFYDGMSMYKAYMCEIVKTLKSGYKIKNLDEPGLYEDLLFKFDGTTNRNRMLYWEYETDSGAMKEYNDLRGKGGAK